MKALLTALAAVVALAGGYATQSDSFTLDPCTTEDQMTSCYWDASEQGNGQGTDFVVLDGVVYYPAE